MKIHLRFDDSNPAHTQMTVFINGANCGRLVMRTEEACSFHQILGIGCKHPIDKFVSDGKVAETV